MSLELREMWAGLRRELKNLCDGIRVSELVMFKGLDAGNPNSCWWQQVLGEGVADIGIACWRQEEVEIEKQGIGWLCVHGDEVWKN